MNKNELDKNYPNRFDFLDEEEKELFENFKTEDIISDPNFEETKEMFAKAARNTLRSLRKDARVNIRVPQVDMNAIKERATEAGIPYQTVMASVLHQFATGKVKVEL